MGIIFRRPNNIPPPSEHIQQQSIQPKNENIMVQQQSVMKQEKQQIVHVYIKFKDKATQKQITSISKNDRLNDMMKNQTWCVDFSNEELKINQFLDIISECQGIKTIKVITPPKQPLYCLNLLKIKFSHLNKLILSDCWLESIQFFAQLYMPNLRQLNLSNNYLINIKTLRRIKAPIQVLIMRNNKLPSIIDSDIHHIYFNQEIECFNLQESGNKYYGDDTNWLFKLPSKTITRLEINSRFRISISTEKYNKIRRRFIGSNGIFCWGPRYTLDYY